VAVDMVEVDTVAVDIVAVDTLDCLDTVVVVMVVITMMDHTDLELTLPPPVVLMMMGHTDQKNTAKTQVHPVHPVQAITQVDFPDHLLVVVNHPVNIQVPTPEEVVAEVDTVDPTVSLDLEILDLDSHLDSHHLRQTTTPIQDLHLMVVVADSHIPEVQVDSQGLVDTEDLQAIHHSVVQVLEVVVVETTTVWLPKDQRTILAIQDLHLTVVELPQRHSVVVTEVVMVVDLCTAQQTPIKPLGLVHTMETLTWATLDISQLTLLQVPHKNTIPVVVVMVDTMAVVVAFLLKISLGLHLPLEPVMPPLEKGVNIKKIQRS